MNPPPLFHAPIGIYAPCRAAVSSVSPRRCVIRVIRVIRVARLPCRPCRLRFPCRSAAHPEHRSGRIFHCCSVRPFSCHSVLLYGVELVFLPFSCRSGFCCGLTVIILPFIFFGWCVLLTAKEPKPRGFRFPGPLNDSGRFPETPLGLPHIV